MLSGYRAGAPDQDLVERVSAPKPLYEALAMVRIMNDFDSLSYPAEKESVVMERIRTDVQALFD